MSKNQASPSGETINSFAARVRRISGIQAHLIPDGVEADLGQGQAEASPHGTVVLLAGPIMASSPHGQLVFQEPAFEEPDGTTRYIRAVIVGASAQLRKEHPVYPGGGAHGVLPVAGWLVARQLLDRCYSGRLTAAETVQAYELARRVIPVENPADAYAQALPWDQFVGPSNWFQIRTAQEVASLYMRLTGVSCYSEAFADMEAAGLCNRPQNRPLYDGHAYALAMWANGLAD